MMRSSLSKLPLLAAAWMLAGCGAMHLLPATDEDFAAQPSAHIMDRVSGHWQRQGDKTCVLGPEITRDHSQLQVTAGQQKTVYLIESNGLRKGVLRVTQPVGGPRYRLRSVADTTLSGARNFRLTVQNLSTGATETWTPCSI